MKQDATVSVERRQPAPPKASKGSLVAEVFRVGAPLIILAGGIAAFVGLASLRKSPESVQEQALAPMVETVAVEPHTGGLDIEVDGVVVPFREINLSAEVSGRIAMKSKLCRAGTYVPKGTPLIEIDDRDYKLEVERLKRELAQAAVMLNELDVEIANTKSLLKLSTEQLALQRRELERQKKLAERKIVTDSELDQTKRDELAAVNAALTLSNELRLLNTRTNRLESARDLSQSQLEKAQLDLSRTKVAAPIDGVVIEEMVEEDSYVQMGTVLVKLEDTSAVEVRCNLKMEDLYWLWAQAGVEAAASPTRDYQIPPAPVSVHYELAGRRYTWEGVLSRFDGIGVDERTRTVPCRVLVEQPRNVKIESLAGDGTSQNGKVGPPALVRGMYVTVSVHAQPQMTLLEVPQRAVQPGNTVWHIQDGRLNIRKIQVAEATDDFVLVYADASGLAAGAKLVSSPLDVATDGMTVRERVNE